MIHRSLVAVVLLASLVARAPAEELHRIKYNHPGLAVDLGVGLWGWPLPMDYDGDGDLDLVVSCSDVPYFGTYLFENPGGDSKTPLFKPAKRLGAGLRNVGVSYVEGKPRVLVPAGEVTGFLQGNVSTTKRIYPKSAFDGKVRANQWSYVDYDDDGALDIVVGQGHWAEYGWDNAFDKQGNWTRGPLHGYVYLLRNSGATDKPEYEQPRKITAAGKPVDVYGMPSPNLADFDRDGDLDLLCGDFLDGFTYFQNTGTRKQPEYAAGKELLHNGQPLNMPLCMIVVSSIDWDSDGDVDLIVGQEDGRVALVEHLGKVEQGLPQFAPPVFFQQQADDIKFGALVTPVSIDWDADGDEDLICGNTAGEVGFIENLDGGNPPRWAAPKLLYAGDQVLRIEAGDNGSIQGPAETKWGYTTLDVADWDHDGKLDLIVNSIWGKVVWYRNTGDSGKPKLAEAQPVEVQWSGPPPKPAWNWWEPTAHELATQWRTTPLIVDWNDDGLHDLVMLDHQGYLAMYPRRKVTGQLQLLPPQRIFTDESGKPLRLNSSEAGKSGRRKLCLVDWDGDGLLDLLVNSRNVDFYRNQGEKNGKTAFKNEGPLSETRLAGHTTSPTTVDWNGDKVPDLLVGAEDGYLYYQQNEREHQASLPASDKRTNVLFIAVDDMRVDLGCYGQHQIQSPHIDALAARGLRFDKAYCQQAVCNPSRASLLTGLRLDTLGIWDLPTHFRERVPGVVTLPQMFKNNGYFTQNIGKIFHNWRQEKFRGDAASWSVPAEMHYASHGMDKPQTPGEAPPSQIHTPKTEMRDVPDSAYFDGRIADKAVAALREMKGRPFFLAVGFWKPHSPFNAPKKYWDLYDREQIEPPSNPLPPKNVPSVALHDSREILRAFADRPEKRPTAEETLTLRHGYYAAISYVDAQIGKVLTELDRQGLRENTIVVLWSDHGYHLGEHSLWAKTSNFELDARVPLIIALPGKKSVGVARSVVELLDLYPTLADLCELSPPKNLQGVSLRPILEDPSASVKPGALTQHPRPAYPAAGKDPAVMGYSYRSPRYRFTQWRDFQTGETVAEELYDHQADPQESINQISKASNLKVVETLRRDLQQVAPR